MSNSPNPFLFFENIFAGRRPDSVRPFTRPINIHLSSEIPVVTVVPVVTQTQNSHQAPTYEERIQEIQRTREEIQEEIREIQREIQYNRQEIEVSLAESRSRSEHMFLLSDFFNVASNSGQLELDSIILNSVLNSSFNTTQPNWGSLGLSKEQLKSNSKVYLYTKKRQELLLSEKKEEPECSICQDTIILQKKVRILNCGHEYHFTCIGQWFKKHNTCPICRMEFH
jgi:hypothetical protein